MPGGGRGCIGGGGRGSFGRKRQRQHHHHHHQQQGRRHHRPPAPPAVDPEEFERQLEEQRRRQQQQQQQQRQQEEEARPSAPSQAQAQQQQVAVAAAVAGPVPFFLRGFEYDPARQRYFPRQQRGSGSSGRGRGRGGVLGGAPASAASSAASAAPQQPPPPSHGLAAAALPLRGGIWARLRDRERTGVGRAGVLMGSMVRSCLYDEGDRWPVYSVDLERDGPFNDMDFKGGRLAITAGRSIRIDFLAAEGRPCDWERSRTFFAPSPVTQARWRPVHPGPSPDTLAVVEAGDARGGASVVVHASLEAAGGAGAGAFERREDRYALQGGEAWAVEWEPSRGERLLVGGSRHTPVRLLDARAQRWATPHPGCRLHSDCFAPCWLGPDGALLGLRNGEVRLIDFRAPSPGGGPPTTTMALPLVAKMGNVVDQVGVLSDGRGLLVSDRLGGLRLGDLRVPGRTVRDLLAPPAAGAAGVVVASTGFALEPWTESACATLSWDGTVRLLSLRGAADEDPVLLECSSIDDGIEEDEDVRYFLARRWEGRDFAAGVRDPMAQMGPGYFRGPWPPLWCGDRRTGRVFGLQFPRAFTRDLVEGDDPNRW